MLRKIKLYGELAEFVGYKELEAVVNSTGDAICFLVTNFPKLEAHMNKRYYKVLVDDKEIKKEEINYPTGLSDIKIVPVIVGSGGAGRLLLGAALVGLAFATAGASVSAAGGLLSAKGFAAAGIGTKGLLGIGGALVLGGAAELLFPIPKFQEFNNEEDPRISFSFSGIQNTARAGTSHPIVYGEIVTGSVVISAGIDTNQVTA